MGDLDPAAFGWQAETNSVGESGDGLFDIYDQLEGGDVIFWWFHSVGLRPVGHILTAEELAQATPATTSYPSD